MNKPTIREEFIEKYLCLYDTDMSGFGTNLIDEIADYWLNKIKEVVGEKRLIPPDEYEPEDDAEKCIIAGRIGENNLRQRILKEFGIIK